VGNLALKSILLLVTCLFCIQAQASRLSSDFDYYVSGTPDDTTPVVTGGLMLMGGGAEVAPAFRWMLERAGQGRVLVLRASGRDEYHQVFKEMGSTRSIETIVFKNRDASFDKFVIERLRKADLIFLSGGDQLKYVRFWQDTPVSDILNERVRIQSVVLGGTSAGLAILGSDFFTAEDGSALSEEVLKNPFDSHVHLGDRFLALPFLQNLITDTHFAERDRMGRLLGFLARLAKKSKKAARAIGVDQETALIIETSGQAQVLGKGSIYFLSPQTLPEVCEVFTPLTFENVPVQKLRSGDKIDLNHWSAGGGLPYEISAKAGALHSTQASGSVY
jgi:cyanophycinase